VLQINFMHRRGPVLSILGSLYHSDDVHERQFARRKHSWRSYALPVP